ncbi:hypothetical protein SLS62_001561 [Diatrype stigma]|uniref:Uncharacterized protein n=1 Tax=Diatrype stigma TaxID=117547 RepID=A0AAN9YWE4_9PEZI
MTAQFDSLHNLKSLFGLITSFTSDSSFDAVQRCLEENTSMKQELEQHRFESYAEQKVFSRNISILQMELDVERSKANEHTTRINTLVETNTQLTSELDAEKSKVAERDERLTEIAKTNTSLQEQLEAANAQIKALQDTVQQQNESHNSLSATYEQTSTALEQKSNEVSVLSKDLDALKQWSCVMQSAPEDVIGIKLNNVFEAVHKLATNFFSDGLPKATLDNADLWADLHDKLKWLPLPASNSKEARQMRMAACVGALGSRFAGHIFVPMYVDPDAGEITNLLSSLSNTDSAREVYLRSVLLSVDPEQQKKIRRKRIIEILEAVHKTLGCLVREEKQNAFKADLQEVCKAAVECWEFIRQTEVKVHPVLPSFNPMEDTAAVFNDKDWVPIRLTVPSKDKVPEVNGGPKTNGTGKKNGRDPDRNGDRDQEESPPTTNGVQAEDEPPSSIFLDVRRAVWPAFYIGDGVMKGHVLLNSQAKFAWDEMSSPRRVQRQQKRRNASVSRPPHFLC